MPSRASATPVTPPSDPTIRAVASTIDPSPEAPESSGPIYAEEDKLDIPGPSTAFIPRQPSPPLPDLRRRPHPLDEGSDDEEDDEVVATLPIYLSPRLYPHIQLFQYPLHHRAIAAPSWAIDRGKQITTRFKEGVGRVEVEIPVDADTGVWRDDRARELGFVTDVNAANGSVDVEGGYGFGGRGIEDKKKGKKEKEKKQMWGDKVRLRSEVVPGATGYYSGIIHDGGLHLHPISKLAQLRTSLSYLDDMDHRTQERSSRRKDEEDGEDEKKARATQTAAPGRSKLPIDEDNDGSGSIKDFRNKMWSMALKEEEEKWIPYEWRVATDPSAADKIADKLETMLVPLDMQERLKCTTRGLDYLNRD